MSPNTITEKEFVEYLERIEKCIRDCYNSNNIDIEDMGDMGDIFRVCDIIMYILWTSKENYQKYYDIILLRKLTKKLAHKKFREAHDFYFKEEIEQGKREKIIKYPDEKPRDIFNVEECEY